MPKNASNADFPLGCCRTDRVRTCHNLLTRGSPWVTRLFIKREGSESTWETQPVFGKIWTIFPAYPRAGPNLPNYKYPELCPLSSHTCEQIWKGSHPRKVISLSEEETASVPEPRRPSVRKSEKRAGRSGPSRQQACPGGSRSFN